MFPSGDPIEGKSHGREQDQDHAELAAGHIGRIHDADDPGETGHQGKDGQFVNGFTQEEIGKQDHKDRVAAEDDPVHRSFAVDNGHLVEDHADHHPQEPREQEELQVLAVQLHIFLLQGAEGHGHQHQTPDQKPKERNLDGMEHIPEKLQGRFHSPKQKSRHKDEYISLIHMIQQTPSRIRFSYSSPMIRTSGSSQTPLATWTRSFTSSISCKISAAVAWPRFTTKPVCFSDT